MMSGYDSNTVHVVPIARQNDPEQMRGQSGNLSLTGIRELMHNFLMGFRLGGNFVYRCEPSSSKLSRRVFQLTVYLIVTSCARMC